MSEQFLERSKQGENAFLVHVQLPNTGDLAYQISEFHLLVKSAGAQIIETRTIKRQKPEVKYFIGKGNIEDIKLLLNNNNEIDLLIFNHDLSPAQQRNLEKYLDCRVLDRTGLILDIFASRAQTHAGKLQVELAQLKHLSTRLIRGWSHLERQKGGIGLRGPGETQLESDRRMIALRIKQIYKKLEKVNATRNLSRQARSRAELTTVSLIGYTNAGKSTLFNFMVDETIYVENRLFSTLDSTMRRLKVSPKLTVVLADTVGFVSRLPHTLVESFKSTLEEVLSAHLLLHVVDVSQDNHALQMEDVEKVLSEINAGDIPKLEVMNKIDAVTGFEPRIDRDETNRPVRVWLSAANGVGCDLLLKCLDELLVQNICHGTIVLSAVEADIRAKLFSQADILNESYADNGDCTLTLRIEQKALKQHHIFERFISM